jgi:hypothetical protein
MTQQTFEEGQTGAEVQAVLNGNANDAEARISPLEVTAGYFMPVLGSSETVVITNTTSYFSIQTVRGRTLSPGSVGFEETAPNSGILRYILPDSIVVQLNAFLMAIFLNANPNRAAYYDFFLNGVKIPGDRGVEDVNNGVSYEQVCCANEVTISQNDTLELKVRNASDTVDIAFLTIDIQIRGTGAA